MRASFSMTVKAAERGLSHLPGTAAFSALTVRCRVPQSRMMQSVVHRGPLSAQNGLARQPREDWRCEGRAETDGPSARRVGGRASDRRSAVSGQLAQGIVRLSMMPTGVVFDQHPHRDYVQCPF